MIALGFLAALVIGVAGGELLRRRSSKPQRTGIDRLMDSTNAAGQAGWTNHQGG